MARQRPLPRDTHRLLNRRLDDCENLGLVFDKFQPWDRTQDGWDTVMPILDRNNERRTTGGEAIGWWFKGETSSNLRDNALLANGRLIQSPILEKARERWLLITKDFVQLPLMWTASPLALGLGQANTLETAITLHPLYGFPYIPGSSVKGVSRAAAFYAIAEQLGVPGLDNKTYMESNQKRLTPFQLLEAVLEAPADEWLHSDALTTLQQDKHVNNPQLAFELKQNEAAALFRQIFGTLGKAGQVIFFDAIPAQTPQIVTEVMTPHFRKYYDSDDYPRDDDSPNPVTYLAVSSGTPFRFALGWRHTKQVEQVITQAHKWLVDGLQNLGMGGKVSSGYGFFWRKKPAKPKPRKKGKPEVHYFYPKR